MTNQQGNKRIWTPTHEAVFKTLVDAFGTPARHLFFNAGLPLRDITILLYDRGMLKPPPSKLGYGFTPTPGKETK